MNLAIYPITSWYDTGLSIAVSELKFLAQLDRIKQLGATSVNVPSYLEKLEYLGDNEKSHRVRSAHDRIIARARELFPGGVTTSGPQLLKWHGLARRDSMQIASGRRERMNHIYGYGADNAGRLSFAEPLDFLAGLPPFTVVKFKFSANGNGRVTLKWTHSNTVLTKQTIRAGQTIPLVYITIPGLYPSHFEFDGDPGTVITCDIWTNDIDSDELDAKGRWIGNDASCFFQCRRPDPTDWPGIYDTLLTAHRRANGVPLLFDWEEDNSPWWHITIMRQPFISRMTELAAGMSNDIIGTPATFFYTDPRENLTDYRRHRACTLQPYTDYRMGVKEYHKMILWGDGNNPTFWAAQEYRARSNGVQNNSRYAWYAGTQNIAHVIDGLEYNKIAPASQCYGIAYADDAQFNHIESDILQLKSLLQQS